MLDINPRRSALMFALVCCLTTVITVQGQQPDNIATKTSGNVASMLRANPTPTPSVSATTASSIPGTNSDADAASKQRELAPLKFTFRTRTGTPFPDIFRQFVPPEAVADTGGPVTTQVFSVAATNDEPLRVGVDVQEVITIEIERPLVLGPKVNVNPRNLGARKSHFVEEFNAEFPNVSGENVTAAVLDGGGVLATHVEFRLAPQSPTPNRVQIISSTTAAHATHVAGTLAAAGRRATAKGMAPSLRLMSDDWVDDLRKLATFAPNIQISNHSYGPVSGWSQDNLGRWYWWGDRQLSKDEDAKFGKYSSREAQLDEVLFRFPHVLTFIAAGNDRDDLPGDEQQPLQHFVIEGQNWVLSSERHNRDGFDDGGLDTIAGLGLAKNAICIGAIDDVTTTSGINMISYSGWGLVDDGRIKPDLVANGHHLLSTSNAGDGEYVDMSGTSMASPTAAGIASLLVQLYQQERGGARPSAAEIKAVMIHTATDAGGRGPDPIYGWGAIHALKAGRVIGQKLPDGPGFRHLVKTDDVTAGQRKDYGMILNGTNDPIKVTMVWTDPPGAANLGGLDDASPALVNDLDIKLISPDGQEFFPYTLDRARPKVAARRDRANHVDNVEVIDLAGPLSGEWKLEVSGMNLRPGATQRFALVISGLKLM